MGDQSAFRSIYLLFSGPVYRYCLSFLGDRATAEDATQETFLSVYSDVKDLRDAGRFTPWLFRIARRHALISIRNRKREVHQQSGETVLEEETPLEITSKHQIQELIREGISKLKPEYREVLHLREFEQFSYAEIALVTGDSESSVRSRLYKARKALLEKVVPMLKEGTSNDR